MDSRSIIRALKADGWREVARRGSHAQFTHPSKPGRVTVPHPKRDIPLGTHKEAKSDYGVSFPDLPGCVTAAKTLDEARAMALEALALHLEGMVKDGEAIPDPSSLAEIMADVTNRDGVAILVDAPRQTAKSVRVNITLPDDLLKSIDRQAVKKGLTRSGFLARAAKRELV
jgi:predicted RNA binding protein YcfA (HicA-like mRNA interferase family)